MNDTIDSESEYPDTPQGWYARWKVEMDAADQEVKQWHRQGDEIVKRFKDERGGRNSNISERRLNLFTSNVQTMRALVMGKTPQVDVSRRFGDAKDDVGRVAGEMLERMLNSDIERESDTFEVALDQGLSDFLLPGACIARCRYVAEFETQQIPPKTGVHPITGETIVLAEGYPKDVKTFEDVECDYVHWKDFRWSPAKIWNLVRWVSFGSELSRKQLIERFGEDVGKRIPLNAKKNKTTNDPSKNDPWSRAYVWEIWSKELKQVFWYVEGFSEILDKKDDPLGIEGFWPMPPPMLANITTSSMVPVPDFKLAQDQYDEIDTLTTRIYLLTKAIKVAGVYDKASGDAMHRLIGEENENTLVPVDNWAMFAEKGGLKGTIEFLPLDQIVAALDKLEEKRTSLIALLFQVTGMSDVMRGQAVAQTTATEQAIKARFASVRTQRLQDTFAKFASGIQRIKGEIISKHFDPQTILQRSNAQFMFDAPIAIQAVQLIKSEYYCYRVSVKPEAISLTDFAALKGERTEFLAAVAQFISVMAPAIQAMPGSMPFMLQMLQWGMAGFRGSAQIEGILDQAISQATQMQQQQGGQPQKQDPRLQAVQFKAQADMAHQNGELQGDLMRMQAEVQAEAKKQATKFAFDQAKTAAQERSSALRAVVDATTGGGQ